MIEIFEGRLGGGKTYFATYRILSHLAQGGIVCTNVDLIWPGCVEYGRRRLGLEFESDQLVQLEDNQICDFYKFTPSGTSDLAVLVVLDEAHIHFNARDFAVTDKMHRETLTFLTQSRKVDTDIIFISQSALNLDKQFFRLVQYIWRFRDLARWKVPVFGVKSPYKGIVACQYDYDGKTMLDRQFLNKDKDIFSCYRTKSLVRGFVRLEGLNTKRVLKKVKKSKIRRYAVLCSLFLGLLFDVVVWSVNLCL